MSKPDVRSCGILNTGASTFLLRTTTLTNSTDSPLLSAPPEVRNRIYRLVLGGKTIHIVCCTLNAHDPSEEEERVYGHVVCQATVSDDEAVCMMRYGDRDTQFPECHHCRHASCYDQWRSRHTDKTNRGGLLDLPLLRTCSQVHREAALIPFHHNVFAIDSEEELQFRKRLVPIQLLSIRSVITQAVGLSLPFSAKLQFPGLTNFTAVFKMHDEVMGIDEIQEASEEMIRELLFFDIEAQRDEEYEWDQDEDGNEIREDDQAWDHVKSFTICLIPERDGLIQDVPTVALLSRKVERAMQTDCPRCRLVSLGEQVPKGVAAGSICHYVLRSPRC